MKTHRKLQHRVSAKTQKKIWGMFRNDVVANKTIDDPAESCIIVSFDPDTYASHIASIPPTDYTVCSRCNQTITFVDDGCYICTTKNCGGSISDVIDQTPEWRYYSGDDSHGGDPSRCGMPENALLKESTFGSKLLYIPNGKHMYEMQKLKRYNSWINSPYKEKSQYGEFQRIIDLASAANITKKIIDMSLRYHKQISEYDITYRGGNREAIIASSVYLACKSVGNFRTIAEIAKIFHIDLTTATKGCKHADYIINDVTTNTQQKMFLPETTCSDATITPDMFMDRFCSKLSIGDELKKLCRLFALIITKNEYMPENTPISIAAGIVYYVAYMCNMDITKQQVSQISGISDVTIIKCYKTLISLQKQKKIAFPTQIINTYDIRCI